MGCGAAREWPLGELGSAARSEFARFDRFAHRTIVLLDEFHDLEEIPRF